MLQEHVFESLGSHAAAACTTMEFVGDLLGITCGAVDGDDVRWWAVVLEGDAVRVGYVWSADGWVLVGEDITVFLAGLCAGVIGA